MTKHKNEKLAEPERLLPKTPVRVGGKTYDLCFDIEALMEAEASINDELARAGRDERIFLAAALPPTSLQSAVILFAAGVRKFHPEIGFEEAKKLVKLADIVPVTTAVIDAYTAASPEPPKNPPQAGE